MGDAFEFPKHVWLDPESREAGFIGDDVPTGDYGYFVCDSPGILGAAQYVKARLCDGCIVRDHWEHRCHGGDCQCYCREPSDE